MKIAGLKRVAVAAIIALTCSLAQSHPAQATVCTPAPNSDLSGCNFDGVDLRNADLSGSNLSETSFRGTALEGANFSSSNLTGIVSGGIVGRPTLPPGWVIIESRGYLIGPGANLQGANLKDLSLLGVDLTGANLVGADLRATYLTGSVLNGVTSGNTLLGGATLPGGWSTKNGYLIGEGANLSGANFEGVDLRNSSFVGANLSGVNLRSANLRSVDLSTANLQGLKSGALVYGPLLPAGWKTTNGYIVGPDADLTNAGLTGSNLSGVDLRNATLTGVSSGGVTGTPILPADWALLNGYLIGPGANLSGANLSDLNLRGRNLANANLNGATLIRTDLTAARLEAVSLVGVRSGDTIGRPLVPPDWTLLNGYLIGPGANLSGANLFEVNLQGINLANADLTGALLNRANLTGTNLSHANLQLTSLLGAELEGVTSGGITGAPNLSPTWQLRNGHLIGPEANLTGADLTNADLRSATLTGVRSGNITGTPTLPTDWILRNGHLIGPEANLTGADLTNADLNGVKTGRLIGTPALPVDWKIINGFLIGPGANLENADLSFLSLTGNLDKTNLVGASLSGVSSSNIVGTPLLPTDWILRNGYLIGPGANLEGANLEGANLTLANLNGVTSGEITGTPILPTGWILRNGYLIGPEANLEGADLSSANLSGVSSGGITGTPRLPLQWRLVNGYLTGPGANLNGADLSGANLQGLDLGSSSLLGANLSNANLTGAHLSDVISGSIIGLPTLPGNWRLVNGVLVGGLNFAAKPNPTITGTLRVGSTLTGNLKSWKPTPTSVTFEWYSDGIRIRTAQTITLTPDLIGKKLILKAVSSKSKYNTTVRYSSETAVIGAGAFTYSPAPVLSGSPIVGKFLTAKVSPWLPAASMTFEWFADGVSLNASGQTLLLTTNELGKRITVQVTGSRDGFDSVSRSSSATSAVQLPTIPKFTQPKIKLILGSKYALGSTLGVTLGTWAPGTSFGYQWMRNGVPIVGATESTYPLIDLDVSKKITVLVTGELEGFRPQPSTSSSTSSIEKANLTAATALAILGNPVIGERLSTNATEWMPAADSYKYVWKRDGSTIKYASSSTYLLQSSDKGKKITVSITAIKNGYNAFTKTSGSTAKVILATPAFALVY